MRKIKDYLVRLKKKNKTVGRPSKEECIGSEIVSWIAIKPTFRNLIRQKLLDYYLTGNYSFSKEEFKNII